MDHQSNSSDAGLLGSWNLTSSDQPAMPTDSIPSEQDVSRLESEQIQALYEKHVEQLRRFIFGLLRDAQLTEDVLQLTFIKAIEQGHTAKEESRKAWLYRVAYNEAMGIRRREATGDRIFKKVATTMDHFGPAAEDSLIRQEVVISVRDAIEKLSAPQQQVLKMRMYEEKTFAEIAEELSIPLGTALTRMRSAMKYLKKQLSENE